MQKALFGAKSAKAIYCWEKPTGRLDRPPPGGVCLPRQALEGTQSPTPTGGGGRPAGTFSPKLSAH